jgi:ABC-type glycerol-3-phosphate transport system substrate-binding protein
MLNMKKAIAAVGALAMSAGLLAGCGSGSGGSDEGVGTKDSPVELTFWTWQPTDAQWKSIYAAFQKKYPNIKINWWRTSEMADYQKKLQTSMAGGEGPDVFGVQVRPFRRRYEGAGRQVHARLGFQGGRGRRGADHQQGWQDGGHADHHLRLRIHPVQQDAA